MTRNSLKGLGRDIQSSLLKLGYEKPALRPHLRPILDAMKTSRKIRFENDPIYRFRNTIVYEINSTPESRRSRDISNRYYTLRFKVWFEVEDHLPLDESKVMSALNPTIEDLMEEYSTPIEGSDHKPNGFIQVKRRDYTGGSYWQIYISGTLQYDSPSSLPDKVDDDLVLELGLLLDNYLSRPGMNRVNPQDQRAVKLFTQWADSMVKELNGKQGVKAMWQVGSTPHNPIEFKLLYLQNDAWHHADIGLGSGYRNTDPYKLNYTPSGILWGQSTEEKLGVSKTVSKYRKELEKLQKIVERDLGYSLKQAVHNTFAFFK